MKSNINKLLAEIDKKKKELIVEYEKLKNEYGFSFKKGKIIFDEKRKQYNKTFKESIAKYFLASQLRHIISAPFIYMMFIPTIFFDIFLFFYQRICFTLYRIPFVRRKDYIIYDRKHLSYLNWFQKFNCIYCSYVNGFLSYAVEVAGRTERYRCPIKHAKKMDGWHSQQKNFADYGDAKGFQTCFVNRDGKAFRKSSKI